MNIGEYIRFCIDRACEAADVVVWHPVYYDYLLDFFLEMQHKHQKPFVVEVDDNLIDVPPWNEAFYSFEAGSQYRRVGLDCMKNADALIVSTPHLKETYSAINPNIHVVENSLDFRGDRKFVGWDKAEKRRHNDIRIGWIGGRTHFEDLMEIGFPMADVLARHEEARLILVNSAFDKSCQLLGKKNPFSGLKNVLYADRSVAINRYAQFMASFGFDIGIAPLVDCNFNRSKSNLRWLEYSALKVPTIATDVSHFSKTINHGQDGILVNNNVFEEWVYWLELLMKNQSLAESIGQAAYKRVKNEFNVKRNAARYLRLLKEISNKKSSGELEPREEMVAA